MQLFLLAIVGYLCGSIPTGKLLGRYRRIDIQQHGSGNIGFANAVRVLGWPLGLVVLVVDVAKGCAPLLLAKQLLGAQDAALLFLGLMPIIGHAYPLWLRFRGGKSIAAGLGVLLALAPFMAFCGVVMYCILFAIFRRSAVGSLLGVWSLPLIAIVARPELSSYLLLLALFATYTHRKNIQQFVKLYGT
jgi:acyl phosphate:glycerol-3-phosphate acyltransferase